MSDAAHGFPPLETPGARVLVLGSMPGRRSLAEQRYYAHPQNAFWRIMAEILGFDASLPYADRVRAVTLGGVAVWDVLQFCERPGSLDADIRPESRVINDFSGLIDRQPSLALVCGNGAAAATAWRRQVAPGLGSRGRALAFEQLPSTSPAFAAMRLEQKIEQWRRVIGPVLADL
ncbi:MAG: DNA-deoxyinosine glycosylase [Pseudomonadota bacterium]